MKDVHESRERWILAFDVACGKCRAVSRAVAEASNGALDVLPLTDPDVQQWRLQSMGPAPKWAPTLLRVRRDTSRAWTGPAMALVLAKRLGPRATVRVLSALGQLEQEARRDLSQPGRSPMSRKHFLKIVGGAATAIGLIATTQSPALAKSEHAQASAWVEANLKNLPRSYQEISRYPLAYRKAIHRVLSRQERDKAWVEHFRWYRANHPNLTAAQNQIVEDAIKLVVNGVETSPGYDAERQRLERSAKVEFGDAAAAALLATLGPVPDSAGLAAMDCNCSTVSQYCSWLYDCGTQISCTRVPSDCGWRWQYDCNGTCY